MIRLFSQIMSHLHFLEPQIKILWSTNILKNKTKSHKHFSLDLFKVKFANYKINFKYSKFEMCWPCEYEKWVVG